MKAFELKEDGLEPSGTICYPYGGYDYGLAADDTAITGRPHRSMTLKPFGGPPSFTAPVDALHEIEVDDIPPVDDEHAKTVCKIGQGAACCKFLTMSPKGFSCEKLSTAGDAISYKKDMSAKSDNCPGRASL